MFTFSLVHVWGQTFSPSSALPIDLGVGTNYSNCSSPGTKSISFDVSNVGTLNGTDNQLAEIRLRLDATCGSNIRDVASYIKSPEGTCIRIASSMGSTTNFTQAPQDQIDYYFRNATSCLNKAPNYTNTGGASAAKGQNGQFGIFSSDGDMRTTFDGEDADGTWTIYFFENTSFEPCVTAASLVFGDPSVEVVSAGSGNQCVDAILWDGNPLCTSNIGLTSSTNTPGFNPSYNSGFGCDWNGSNDNPVWIKIIPDDPDVCLTISGITDALQSIVVEDPNTDGDDDPCTGADGGLYWDVVSCPRSGTYNSTAGTTRNHTHCFTAVPGNEYFLVVDGTGGAESSFYLTGISALPVILPVTFLSFSSTCISSNKTRLEWQTASEQQNDYFTIEESLDGFEWREIGRINGAGNSSMLNEYNFTTQTKPGIVYYRLKQTDYDGKFEYLSTISSVCQKDNNPFSYPNPTKGSLTVSQLMPDEEIMLYNSVGQKVLSQKVQGKTSQLNLEITHFSSGIYILSIVRLDKTYVEKIVLNQ